MSVANIFVQVPSNLDPAVSVDKINPALLDTTVAPFTGFVTNPLTANLLCKEGVNTYEIQQAGKVNTAVLETLQIDLLPGSLQTAVAVNDSLALRTTKRVGFDGDAIVTCGGGLKSVVRTRDTLLPTIQYEFADEKVVFSEQLKHLTINPPTVPPQPLLPSQGLTVHGTIAAQNGGISTTGGVVADADIQTNSIFIAKGAGQPRIEFQDGTGFAQGQVGWSSATGRTLMTGDAVKVYSGLDKYKIEMGDVIGYLGLETNGVDTEIRHYDATATTMETRVRVESAGKVSITAPVNSDNATLRLENGGGKGGEITASESGGYMAIQAQAGYNLLMESTGGSVNIATANPDTTLTASVNGGTAQITLTDTAGAGSVNITTSEYFDVFATKEARIQSGESIKITSSLDPATAPSVAIKNQTGNCVLDMEAQGGKGGQIIADEGAQVIILKGRDGFNAGITGASLVAISTEDTASAIGMTAGPAGANIDIVANGDDTGKITMIAQTGGTASQIEIDGSTTVGIINAFADQINIGANGASATVSIGTPNATIAIDEASTSVQVSGKLIPEGGISDVVGSLGTINQVLTSTGSQVMWGTLPLVWGSFLNTGSVSIATPNLATAIPHNTTTVASNCALSGGSIVIFKACSKLRIQSSLIASPSANNTTFRFWLFKSPANVPNSQSIVSLKSVADKALCVCEWYVSAVVGDVFTVLCEADFASTIYAEAGTASRPACPSIITTLTGFV